MASTTAHGPTGRVVEPRRTEVSVPTISANIFQDVQLSDDKQIATFRMNPTKVGYANTLRRLILTGVETIAFNADLTDAGTSSDVRVLRNSTPMTNEMLSHRIGLLPINIPNPLEWAKEADKYTFKLEVKNENDLLLDVSSGDFTVFKEDSESGTVDTPPTKTIVVTEKFFPKNQITQSTCLIATLKAKIHNIQDPDEISLEAKASLGTGRDNARWTPVSQCSYGYTLDPNEEKKKMAYETWLQDHKKVTPDSLKETPDKAAALMREFDSMEVARCYLTNEDGEPYSFDFKIETIGVLSIPYIVRRACEVGEEKCLRYSGIADSVLPIGMTIVPSPIRMKGFDFLIQKEDHTLGNLLQTWLDINKVSEEGPVSYAGYIIPHPLKDEMLFRIGVLDGKERTAREALAEAAQGCAAMFRTWKAEWERTQQKAVTTVRKVPRIIRRQ